MIEADFYSYLTGEATITAHLGNRIYPDASPQDATLPLLVYEKTSVDRQMTLRGATGVSTARISCDIFAASRTVCETIVESIRLRVDGFQGNWNTTFIHQSRIDSEDVGWDLESAKETGIHRATIDVVVLFTETVTDFFGG